MIELAMFRKGTKPFTTAERELNDLFFRKWQKAQKDFEKYQRRLADPEFDLKCTKDALRIEKARNLELEQQLVRLQAPQRPSNAMSELLEKLAWMESLLRQRAQKSASLEEQLRRKDFELSLKNTELSYKNTAIVSLENKLTDSESTSRFLSERNNQLQIANQILLQEKRNLEHQVKLLQAQPLQQPQPVKPPTFSSVSSMFPSPLHSSQSEKMIPWGLTAIHKVLDTIGPDSREYWVDVRLVFSSDKGPEDFKTAFQDKFYNAEIFFMYGSNSKTLFIGFHPRAKFAAGWNDNPARRGEIIMGELEKYLDLTQCTKDFWRRNDSTPVNTETSRFPRGW